jgi:hypothetical protein
METAAAKMMTDMIGTTGGRQWMWWTSFMPEYFSPTDQDTAL